MLAVISLVLPLFGIVILGYISGRIAKLSTDALGWLNFFIIYIALPPLFFNLLSTTPVEEFRHFRFFFTALGVTFAMFLISFGIALVFRRAGIAVATIQGLAGAYGNIGYLGPPLAIAAFGPAAGVPVALLFCLENTMHFILAPTLMAFANPAEKSSVFLIVLGIVRRVTTHPFIIATAVGILAAVYEFQLPKSVQNLSDSLASAAAPCALFAMGVTAALRPLKRVPLAVSYIVPIKLVLHPVLMFWALNSIPNVDPTWILTAVLMATLPTAANVFVISQQYQSWEQQASSMVVITTALSILTVTAFLYLAGAG